MWLSIIIPLYNCRRYIAACIDSLLQQGLAVDEYEIVVVDDGSTDGGAEVVKSYCAQHANIRLVQQPNGGVAAARNRGIDEARGEYIEFVDADDRLLPDGLRTLRHCYLADGQRPDMISMGMYTVDRFYDASKYEHIRPHRLYFEGTFKEFAQHHPFGWSSVSRIIRRTTLVQSGVRFEPYTVSEDVMFIMRLFEALPHATLRATDLSFYRYMVRPGSALTTTSRPHAIRVVEGYIRLYGIVGAMRERSAYPPERFDGDLAQFRRGGFIRLLTSHLHLSDMRSLLAKAHEARLYPLPSACSLMQKTVNFFTAHPLMAWLVSLPLSTVYPIVKQWIRRN